MKDRKDIELDKKFARLMASLFFLVFALIAMAVDQLVVRPGVVYPPWTVFLFPAAGFVIKFIVDWVIERRESRSSE